MKTVARIDIVDSTGNSVVISAAIGGALTFAWLQAVEGHVFYTSLRAC